MSTDFAAERRPASAVPASRKDPEIPAVIELRGVSVVSPDDPRRVLIEEVEWTVRGGEAWIVTGSADLELGALLRTAAGLLPVPRGVRRILGRDPSPGSREELDRLGRQVGFVFPPTGRLFADLRVAENVGLALRYHTNRRQAQVEDRVRSLLTLVGAAHLTEAMPAQLDPSQECRIALARALAAGPRLLFVDLPAGPFSGREAGEWVRLLTGLVRSSDEGPARLEAIVVRTDTLRSWLAAPVRVGWVRGGRFRRAESMGEVTDSEDPLLRELLAEPAADG